MSDQDDVTISISSSVPGTSLLWKDVSVQTPVGKGSSKETKSILSSISGYVEAGSILYIMGPSGSGKTTLLDALANRLKLSVTGTQQLNGKQKTGKLLKSTAKYVQQTDDLLGVLSVKESLTYSAQLYGVKNINESVDSTMEVLGLEDHANTKIGNVFMKGLSGGQKRRVSIGQELVAQPQLLFLDEPTSGLDSATAFKVMKHLKHVAESANIALIISIHQPSEMIFELASHLLLISEGKQVYFGGAKEAKTYFESTLSIDKPANLSDVEWLLELVNRDFGNEELVDRVIRAWPKSKASTQLNNYFNEHLIKDVKKSTSSNSYTLYATSFLQQTMILTKRGCLNALRNPAVLWLRLAMYAMLAILIGLVWLRLPVEATAISETNAAIFYICAFMIFMSISVLPAYAEEREILSRERANSAYSAFSYMLSHTLYEIPFLLMLSIICSVIVYFMVGFTLSAERFFIFVLNLFVGLFVAESMMVLISAVIPIVIVGIAAGAMFFGLFMCVMGLFIPVQDIGWWLQWMKFIAVHYFSYSTFIVNQYRGVTYKAVPDAIFPPFPDDVPGESVYRGSGLEERIWVNFVVQIVMILVYRVIAASWIHRYVKGKK